MTTTLPARGRSGRAWSQRARELAAFLDFLVAEGVRSYLEVGARHGDTVAAVADALPVPSTIVVVDLPGAKWGRADSLPALRDTVAYARGLGHTVTLLVGDSTDPAIVAAVTALGPFDAAFVDGDHRLAGVRADWQHYGPLARLVAFHDIAPTPENTRIEVPIVWAEAKARYPSVEFHDPAAPGMGIGVVRIH